MKFFQINHYINCYYTNDFIIIVDDHDQENNIDITFRFDLKYSNNEFITKLANLDNFYIFSNKIFLKIYLSDYNLINFQKYFVKQFSMTQGIIFQKHKPKKDILTFTCRCSKVN